MEPKAQVGPDQTVTTTPARRPWGQTWPSRWGPINLSQSADAMTIEIRRLEDTDGTFHQYALGRPAPAPIRPEVEINWAQNSMTVPANEVFDADGAVTIYFHYLQHRTIPDTYTLRELDLGSQPADQHTTAEWTPEPPR